MITAVVDSLIVVDRIPDIAAFISRYSITIRCRQDPPETGVNLPSAVVNPGLRVQIEIPAELCGRTGRQVGQEPVPGNGPDTAYCIQLHGRLKGFDLIAMFDNGMSK